MNRDEVIAKWNSMQPRERDAWIAKDVMCWSVYRYDKDVPERCYYMLVNESFDSVVNEVGWNAGERKTEEEAWEDCPHFTTDISAAWEVIEKAEIMDRIQLGLYPTSFGKWIAKSYMAGYENCRVQADSAPEAICLAALIATQGEGIEE
ncbi:BC1872 family protein [Paenibacillus polymyxa]|uniref:BC1872 family protein n=1 Tax=Paenibacillus polymyxa TaxID=1406 RepID=UPI002379E26F|nr:hypothetical protein [Paenibacillus polymyxa]WDM22627.1 hypothetical protein J4I02_03120 [Paenibacillus polymyxa]